MGSWFSNIHIRKCETVTEKAVAEYISKLLAAQKYLPAVSERDADGAVAIVSDEDNQWISVYSDLLSIEDPKSFEKIAAPLSSQLHSDVLGISCFDSDYLYLNLINSEEKTDAWIGIGSASGLGIKRQSSLAAWKNKVADFASFSKAAKEKYVFAEEFLGNAESSLGLPELYSSVDYAYLQELGLNPRYFYFKLPEEMKSKEPTKLVPLIYSGMPCFLEKPSVVDGINVGGESRGLSVYFLGPYVEKEEITFSNVCFVKRKNNQTQWIPFELSKVRLPNGQWAYYYHDPGFRIPPKVDDRIPVSKRMRIESEHSIIVRFVPHGNPKKILDITVALVPDKNPEGLTSWNVWHHCGSKKAFIDEYNKTWEKHRRLSPDPNACPPILQERFVIQGTPSILYGDSSENLFLHIHGKMGSKEEAVRHAEIVCPKGYQVLSIDLPGHGERAGEMERFVPWEVVPELQAVYGFAQQRWKKISLYANSIGAYFSLLAFQEVKLEKSLFVSPVLDMEKLIRDMMGWAGVTLEQLQQAGEIPTTFGETLSWKYLTYAAEHRITKWDSPTAILYAGQDHLTARETVVNFAQRFGCMVTVIENGEHWFHTEEQLAVLDTWLQKETE